MRATKRPQDEVNVTFRFVGDLVDPEMITARLEIVPTDAHHKGDIIEKHPERKYPTGLWSLESQLGSDLPLDQHLRHLLSILEPKASTLAKLKAADFSPEFFADSLRPQRTWVLTYNWTQTF